MLLTNVIKTHLGFLFYVFLLKIGNEKRKTQILFF